MDVALFHHFPMIGGAPRVLREYVVHSPEHEFTLYTRQPEAPGLMQLPDRVKVRRFAPLEAGNPAARLALLWRLPGLGREVAAAIDAGGHDAVFAHASFLVQAPEVLPHLRTPCLYYAPEPLRAAYEPMPAFGRDSSLRGRIVAAGLDPYERKRKALDRRHITGGCAVATHSRFTAGELEAIYGVRAHVVPLGVDADAFTPGDGEREDFVLSVGALHPLKGHQFVVAAIATLPPPRPRLMVIGDRGDAGPLLEALAARLGVALEIHRGLPFDAVTDAYRRAGVVACGQIREPFGLITLEAMASGAPVVAVREGGLAETVVDGSSGLLTGRDPRAFGAALARVLGDPELAARLVAGGIAEARRWTWSRSAAAFNELLGALARPRDAAPSGSSGG